HSLHIFPAFVEAYERRIGSHLLLQRQQCALNRFRWCFLRVKYLLRITAVENFASAIVLCFAPMKMHCSRNWISGNQTRLPGCAFEAPSDVGKSKVIVNLEHRSADV